MDGSVLTRETAELERDALVVFAHDLVGVGTSLALRADALAGVLSAADHAAFLSLTEELREISRHLRMLAGPQGSHALAPGGFMTGVEWWRVVARLTTPALPRGVLVQSQVSASQLTRVEAHGLTYLWLAACKELTLWGLHQPCTVSLSVEPHGKSTTGAMLVADVPAALVPVSARPGRPSRWHRFAARIASRRGAKLEWWRAESASLRWTCSIPATTPG